MSIWKMLPGGDNGILFTGWWRQYLVWHSTGVTDWVSVYVNISPFEEWHKISSKISLVMWHRAINWGTWLIRWIRKYLYLQFYAHSLSVPFQTDLGLSLLTDDLRTISWCDSFESNHGKTVIVPFTSSKGSDQTAHMCSLIWAFAVHYHYRARHIYPSLVLVQPRKTCPCLTETLMMERKESN